MEIEASGLARGRLGLARRRETVAGFFGSQRGSHVPAKLQEITATLAEVRWPPNTDTFFIAKIKPVQASDQHAHGTVISATGNGSQDELKTHLTYRWFGRWSHHDIYGPQFRIDTWTPAKPHGKAGVVKYLSGCPHIGEATALQLWNEFNTDAVRICRENPEVVASVVKRLSADKCREIAAHLAELSDLEDTSIDLIETLAGRGFPKGTAREAMRVWGAKAPAVINKDPYKLMRFRGCGFLKCDKMWLDLGLPAGRMKRQVCCAWHAIATDRDGHVWMPLSKAVEGIKDKIAGAELEPDKAIAIAKRFGALSTMRDCLACGGTGVSARVNLWTEQVEQGECLKCGGSGGVEWIAETRRAEAESRVVSKVADMLDWTSRWPSIDGPEFASLTPHQRAELAKATRGAIGALCGSPGAGKTWSVAALVKSLINAKGRNSVAICCPTGKAAQRAKEAMRLHGIDIVATTIHRMLGVEKAGDGDASWSFKHGEWNPLPFDYVIGDEWSMCGLGLMSSVLAAMARGTNFLMVGDINQLLPVEFGAPLRDIIGTIPSGELREIHRNSGSIVRACAAIRDGKEAMFDQRIEIGRADPSGEPLPPKNLVHVNAGKEDACRKVVELVRELAADKNRFPGFDPIRDIQVLVAVNKRSSVSRQTLSPMLQDILNPHGQSVAGSPFRVGDKVMNTKNGFLLPLDGGEKVMVANGEFGKVLEVSATKTVVEFYNPSRVVLIPKAKSDGKAKGGGQKDGDAEDSEGDATGCDLVLGYAQTVWKMQGSSAPIIVGVIDEYPGATGAFGNCDRAFIYTMLSRAERECHVVGLRSTMRNVCKRVFISRRKTFTAELLTRELASRGVHVAGVAIPSGSAIEEEVAT